MTVGTQINISGSGHSASFARKTYTGFSKGFFASALLSALSLSSELLLLLSLSLISPWAKQ
jgi:hypothetical protein